MQNGAPSTSPERSAAPDVDAALLAAAFAASPVATVLIDVRGPEAVIAAANPAFGALAGRVAADLVGRPYPPEAVSEGDTRLAEAVAARRATQVRLAAAQGAVEVRLAPVTGAAGAVTHLCATHVALDGDDGGHALALKAALDQQTALLHELDHRVKNNLQVITSLILLKARRTSDGAARAALSSMADRIGALSSAHRLLYAVGDVSRFDLRDFVADFVADLAVLVDPARITVEADAQSVPVAASKAAPLALLVHELATNAVRHAFPGDRTGRVAIVVRREDGTARLVVEDDGVGRDAAPPTSEGFGRALVDMVVRQMRGTLVHEDRAPGTRVTVTIPLQAEEAADP
jgi:two-component sensor histidine kinase